MSQHDSESESDGSITPSSTASEDYPREVYVEGRVCHFLGHIEAIPINREGTLVQVHHAWIRITDPLEPEFSVLSSNPHGPRFDFCYKLPGPGNNWLARTSDDTDGTTELFETVQKYSTKGYKLHVYQGLHMHSSSWIIESYLKEEKKEKVPEGIEMIWDLQQRLGFEIGDMYGRHFRDRPSKYNEFGRETAMDGDEYDDEDERLDRGEYLDEDEESYEGSDEEVEDEEDQYEHEESVPTIGAIWQSLA